MCLLLGCSFKWWVLFLECKIHVITVTQLETIKASLYSEKKTKKQSQVSNGQFLFIAFQLTTDRKKHNCDWLYIVPRPSVSLHPLYHFSQTLFSIRLLFLSPALHTCPFLSSLHTPLVQSSSEWKAEGQEEKLKCSSFPVIVGSK